MLEELVRIAADKRAKDVVALDVAGLTSYADYFLIASGHSNRQVKAMANAMLDLVREKKMKVLGAEGVASAKWILLDFGEVVAHLFFEPVREFYDLEGLWTDAKRVDLSEFISDESQVASEEEENWDEEDWGDDDEELF